MKRKNDGVLALLGFLVFGLVWLFIFVLLTGPAKSHEWYDDYCCDEQDCEPVPLGSVRWTPQGWEVKLDKGDHRMVDGPMTVIVPEGAKDGLQERVRASQDRRFHACIYGGYLRCLYVPKADG
jgi:hypothetical protein